MTVFNSDGSHPGELDTYKHIVNWANSPFPYSLNDGFDRYGFLGMLSHLTLSALPDSNILEIGAGESSIYLTETARRLNRKIFYCDIAEGKITNPLTVKGYLHENTQVIYSEKDFNLINTQAKAFIMPSDEMFSRFSEWVINNIGFVFIDGDHIYEQVKKDFDNTFKLLVPDGIICLHDTYPPTEEYTSEHRCGTVYKLRQELEKRTDLDCFTFTKTVGVSVGITMVRKKVTERPYYNE